MNAEEVPVAFECGGEALIGVAHVPAVPGRRGVVAIVAGGPQYRGGCCRQLVTMGRALAARGIPVMRFDYRGLGDGSGDYRGFEHIGEDMAAAIDSFRRLVPAVEEIVLWGGCDAASAALIHGPGNPRVVGMVLGNPWVHSEQTEAQVLVRHYYWQRVREKAFWMKLLSLRLNPFAKLLSLLRALRQSRNRDGGQEAPAGDAPFPQRMLAGLTRFRGRILLLMSGLSLVSKEFDQLVAGSPGWQRAMANLDVARVDFPEADQAFSTIDARDKMIAAAGQWLAEWPL